MQAFVLSCQPGTASGRRLNIGTGIQTTDRELHTLVVVKVVRPDLVGHRATLDGLDAVDPAFADAVLEIVEREGVDVVLPQSSFDLEGLAAHRDRFPVPVLVSSPDTIHRSNDKAETYALLHRIGVPAPGFRRVNGAAQVDAAARELGYPDRPVCFKPVFSSGSIVVRT